MSLLTDEAGLNLILTDGIKKYRLIMPNYLYNYGLLLFFVVETAIFAACITKYIKYYIWILRNAYYLTI